MPAPAAAPGYLRRLGLFGMERIEEPLLAALVTGDPILLVGPHGTAKTLLARRLAEALQMRFHAYDASKALFEDVLGFPNPQALSEGRIEYVSTPISIWDKEFVFVDEISRASPSMQNKWLEVIRGRSVMGQRAERLRYVMAAMNPPTYLGALPLDEALAGRFAVLLPVPGSATMKPEDLGEILRARAEEDAPLVEAWRSRADAAAGRDLARHIEQARAALPRVEERFGEPCRRYVLYLHMALSGQGNPFDPRRYAMLYRTLLALFALRATGPAAVAEEELAGKGYELYFIALRSSLPCLATGSPPLEEAAYIAHMEAMGMCARNDSEATPLDCVSDPFEALVHLARRDPPAGESLWMRHLTRAEDKARENREPRFLARATGHVERAMACAGTVSPDIFRRLAELRSTLSGRWSAGRVDCLMSIARQFPSDEANPRGLLAAARFVSASRATEDGFYGRSSSRRGSDEVAKDVRDFLRMP
jgi:hypothetical protein